MGTVVQASMNPYDDNADAQRVGAAWDAIERAIVEAVSNHADRDAMEWIQGNNVDAGSFFRNAVDEGLREIPCPNCKGEGGFVDGMCVQCNGYGLVDAADPLKVPREAGLEPEEG